MPRSKKPRRPPRKVMGDTRKERDAKCYHIFMPLYRAIQDMKDDNVDTIRGEPVVKFSGVYQSTAHTLVAVANVLSRLKSKHDFSELFKLASKLHYGTPITLDEVGIIEMYVKMMEVEYRAIPMQDLVRASKEELEELGDDDAH